MPALLALALSVGVLAVIDTWLFVVPLAAMLPGLVWISFIAWGCHFHSGGGVKGMTTAIVGTQTGDRQDYALLREMCDSGTVIVDDSNPLELAKFCLVKDVELFIC